MKRPIKFIHAADLHLGSIIQIDKKLPENIKNEFTRGIYKSFTRLCQTALKNEVDFVLLAGDVFDREARSVFAVKFFVDQCQLLADAGIPVYVIAGNHDPLDSRIDIFEFPENVHYLKEDTLDSKLFRDKEGNVIARIFGQSYKYREMSDKVYEKIGEITDNYWNIALLHTQLEADNNRYLPCSISNLRKVKGINYWALGHIHKTRILYQDKKTAIAYSGMIQGRFPGEEGVGGALLVELIPGENPVINFMPLASLILKKIELNLQELNDPLNLNELSRAVIDKAKTIFRENSSDFPVGLNIIHDVYNQIGYIVEWTINGRGEIHQLLKEQGEEAVEYLAEYMCQELMELEPFIWTSRIKIRTGYNIPSLKKLKSRNPIIKEILEIEKIIEDSDYSNIIDELGYIWTADSDHENIDYFRFNLDKSQLINIVEQARQLILEELINEKDLL